MCKDFAQTVRFVKFLDQKILDYTTETGEKFPDDDAARVLSQAIDEDTMGRVDDHDDLSIETYFPVKTWILQRDVKLRLRKSTRTGKRKNPDDMVYGVSTQPPADAPAADATVAPGPDPWLSAASDPWSPAPVPSEAAVAPASPLRPDASAAWMSQLEWAPPGGDIDAFGKGKGKGKDQPRGPLECYGCFGKGHLQRLCPTPPPAWFCGQAWRRDLRELQGKKSQQQPVHQQRRRQARPGLAKQATRPWQRQGQRWRRQRMGQRLWRQKSRQRMEQGQRQGLVWN